MKYTKLITFAALAAVAFSCTKEEEDVNGLYLGKGINQVSACHENNTGLKTVIASDQTTVLWSPNESINVFFDGDGLKFTSINSSPKAWTVFQSEKTLVIAGGEDASKPDLWGVYPYSESNTQSGDYATLTVPAEQTAVAGSFGLGTFPTIGKSKTTDIVFYNVCGGVRFKVQNSGIRIVKITGNSNEYLAGKVKVKFDNQGLPYVSEVVDGAKTITLTAPNNGEFQVGTWYYISALPVQMTSGFKFSFIKGTDLSMKGEKSYTSSRTIQRSKFGSMENIDNGVTYTSDYEVQSVTLSTKTLELAPGGNATLSYTILPENAPDKSVSWSTNNSSVAQVNAGVVTAIANGSAVITVTTVNGKTDNCTVTVSSTSGPVLVDLSNATVRTNAPMRKATWLNGADYNAMGGSCAWANWFYESGCHVGAPIPDEMQMRQNRMDNYHTVANLYDGSTLTSFHTNTDYVQTGDKVANSANVASEANYGQHFIQVTLPASAKKINIYLQNDNCPADDAGDSNVIGEEGFILSAKGLSTDYEVIGTYQLNGRLTEGTFKDIVLSTGDYITEFRIMRNKAVGWTFCQNSFGIAEMKVWTVGATSTPGTPSDVTGGGGGELPPTPHTKIPVSAPDAPAGYTKLDLSTCNIETNNPLQYQYIGYTCDGDWTSTNVAINEQQKVDRKDRFGKLANMWDGDKATCFHTNFDVYVEGNSWGIRTGALVTHNHITITLPASYSSICVWICNPQNGGFRMGYTTAETSKGHYHAYIEFLFSNDGVNWSAGSPWAEAAPYDPNSEEGSESMWNDLCCWSYGTTFKYLRIMPHVGETSSGTFGQEAGFFGIGELAIYAK